MVEQVEEIVCGWIGQGRRDRDIASQKMRGFIEGGKNGDLSVFSRGERCFSHGWILNLSEI